MNKLLKLALALALCAPLVVSAQWRSGGGASLPSQGGNSGKFLSTDGTNPAWSTPAGAGDVVGPAASVDNEMPLYSSTSGKLIKRAAFTGLVSLTSGVAAGYAGTSCTNQLVRSLSVSGSATCASVANADLAGSIAASKLVGTDIATVGTLTAGATGAGFTVDLGTSTVSGLLAKVNGGTGTATPALVAGTNVTITGTWPNQTINSSGGGGGGGDALVANPLSQFAATTSAQLRGVISDEVGTGAAYFVGGALGQPASADLTNATSLPIATGVSGLGSNCGTWLATPSSANLRACLTDEVGTGAFYTVGGALGTPASGTATNLTGVTLAGHASQTSNTVVGNATSGSAAPSALSMTSCSTSASAVSWTTNSGFGCNTSINASTLGGATFAAPGPIGGTTPAAISGTTGTFSGDVTAANLVASGTLTNGKVCTYSSTGPTINCNADLAGGGDALTSGNLSQFAATTSAQLRGVLSDEVGTGAAYFVGGALGTPASATLTNATGLPIAGTTGYGTNVATALAVNVGSAGAFVTNGGALGTPSSATLTSATGLPISTGVSGLGSNVAGFLAAASSANLITAVTDETGTGALVFGTAPTISSPVITTKMNLPSVTAFPGSPVTGDVVIVTDDSVAGACDSAAGSAVSLCRYNGSAWAKLGDGTGVGGSLTSGDIDTLAELNAIVGDDDVAGLAAVQTFATGAKTVTSLFNFTGGTLRLPNSTSLPGTCATGDAYMDTDATTGQRFYLCESANTWVKQGDGGAGGGLASTDIDTSAELKAIVTDETGSGALVFATSPTLVTPALGTIASGNLAAGTGYTVANLASAGTGVLTALAATANGAGGVATIDGTKTLTNTTIDAAGTGNVIKLKGYIYLTHPHLCDGTNAVINTTATAISYGHATFSNSVDQATNYCEYYIQVPEDIDTGVALRGRIKVLLGGADTATQRYVLSSVSVADSAVPTGSTLANAINVDFAGDGSGASGDVETSAWTTLTSWNGALTAGQTWRIRFARDGDTSDASATNSTELGLVIEYGITQ